MTSTTSAIQTIPRGASLHKFLVGGQNILLGFPHPSLYATHPHPFFGETIGRTTNRIAHGLLENLNGKSHQLALNNGLNNLHGGSVGWGKRDWKGPVFVKRGEWDAGITGVRPAGWKEVAGTGREGWGYELESPDGEEHFPGALVARVWYFEGRGDKGEVVLDAEYEIKFQDGAEGVEETVAGITNHSYFNLNLTPGIPASLSSHTATLPTATYLKLRTDNVGIPDGTLTNHPEVPSTPDTPFSLTSGPTNSTIPIDDCFIVNSSPSTIKLDTRPEPLHTLATLHGDKSGLNLRVESTEPAFQFYTGGFIDVPAWKAGEAEGQRYEGGEGYVSGSGVCVEPSRYVNAAGQPEWRSMSLLKRGGVFGMRTRYWGWKD